MHSVHLILAVIFILFDSTEILLPGASDFTYLLLVFKQRGFYKMKFVQLLLHKFCDDCITLMVQKYLIVNL